MAESAKTGDFTDSHGAMRFVGSWRYGTEARTDADVVPWSGTGGLAGIRGTRVSVSTYAHYPFVPLTSTGQRIEVDRLSSKGAGP